MQLQNYKHAQRNQYFLKSFSEKLNMISLILTTFGFISENLLTQLFLFQRHETYVIVIKNNINFLEFFQKYILTRSCRQVRWKQNTYKITSLKIFKTSKFLPSLKITNSPTLKWSC